MSKARELAELSRTVSDSADAVAITVDSNENTTFTGVVTANAGVVIDSMTIDAGQIDLSSGDLTLDVAGDIILDTDGGDIRFKDGGTEIGLLTNDSSNFAIFSRVNNKDINFYGLDDGATIQALTLDMSAAGAATFNNSVTANRVIVTDGIQDTGQGGSATVFNESGSTADFRVESESQTNGFIINGAGNFASFGNTVKNPSSGFADQHGVGIDLLTGATQIAADSVPLNLNRTTTAGVDGTYLEFRGGSVVLGAIKIASNDNLQIQASAGGGAGLELWGAGGSIPTVSPIQTTNGATNLGRTSERFGRLHLQDGIQDGGSAGSETVFNDDGTTADFRIETDSRANAFYVDAGTDTIYLYSKESEAASLFTINNDGSGTGHLQFQTAMNTQTNNYVRANIVMSRNKNQITWDTTTGMWNHSGGSSTDWSMLSHVAGGFRAYTGASVAAATQFTNTDFNDNYLNYYVTPTGGHTWEAPGGGDFVFNDRGLDRDFRVESNGDDYAFFVDGGNDRVVVGSAGTDHVNSKFVVVGRQTIYNGQTTGGSVILTDGYAASSNDHLLNIGTQRSSGGPFISYGLGHNQNSDALWKSTYDNFSGNHSVLVLNGATLEYHLDVSNSQTTVGDTVAVKNGYKVGRLGAIFNEDGYSWFDFRVESGGDPFAIFVDASVDAVVMGNNTQRTTGGFDPKLTVEAGAGTTNTCFFRNNLGNAVAGFQVGAITAAANFAIFYNGNGSAIGSIQTSNATAGTTVSYNTSSDARLKENIQDADDAGSKIDAIQVRQFDWIESGEHQKYGMVAQELQTVAPEAVSGDADSEEMMGVDYSKLVPMMLKEIQSLRARVADLES
jgi:hypothetical protein